jgi:thioredoxin 1
LFIVTLYERQWFQVHALPTVFVYKGGKAVTHFKGALPEAQVKQILDSL